MNKQNLYDMIDGLNAIATSGQHPLNSNLAYAVNKNKRVFEKEIMQDYPQMLITPEKKAYNEKYEAMCKQYARKQPNGMPIKNKNGYAIEDEEAFKKAFDELKDKYPKEEKAMKDDNDRYNKYLQKEVNIKIHKVAQKDIANVSPMQYGGIEFIIK